MYEVGRSGPEQILARVSILRTIEVQAGWCSWDAQDYEEQSLIRDVMGRTDSGVRNSVIAGAVSGVVGAIATYVLNNFDVVRFDDAEIILIASILGAVVALLSLYRSYVDYRKALGGARAEVYSLRRALDGIESSRVVGFRVVEKARCSLRAEDGPEAVHVFRNYVGRHERVRIDFKSSDLADFFIEDSGYPLFHGSVQDLLRIHTFRYEMPGVRDWSKDVDCENGYMFAVARLASGTRSADISMIVSELMPVEQGK